MRRALDWLVVDEGGRTAGVVPFPRAADIGMGPSEGRTISGACAQVLVALHGHSANEAWKDEAPAQPPVGAQHADMQAGSD